MSENTKVKQTHKPCKTWKSAKTEWHYLYRYSRTPFSS